MPIRQSDTWRLCFLYSVTFGGFLGLVNYLAIFFHTAFNVDRVSVGQLCATAAFAGALCGPIGGYYADRVGGLAVLRMCASVLRVRDGNRINVVVSHLPNSGFSQCWITGSRQWLRAADRRATLHGRARHASGFIGSAGGFGAFNLPNLLGGLRAFTGGLQAGFLALALIALAGALLITSVRQAWGSTFLRRELTHAARGAAA